MVALMTHLCHEAVCLRKRSGNVQRADVRRPRVEEQVRVQHAHAVLPAVCRWSAGGTACWHLLCTVRLAARYARHQAAGSYRPQQHQLRDGANALQGGLQVRRGPQQRQQRRVPALLQETGAQDAECRS
jgi:hypothetical protein